MSYQRDWHHLGLATISFCLGHCSRLLPCNNLPALTLLLSSIQQPD